MDHRLSVSLAAVVVLAVFIGLVLGHAQHQTVAAPIPTPVPTTAAAPPAGYVNIVGTSTASRDGYFTPQIITVHVGEKVTWVNLAPAYHGVVSDDGTTIDSGPITPGAVYQWTATKPGVFHYSDIYNPTMTGEVIVKR